MGGAAMTCAVSGLPIRPDAKVRYLLLGENPKPQIWEDRYHSLLHVQSLYAPRTFPIKGKYRDEAKKVGNIEKGLSYDLWLEGFQSDLVERSEDESSGHRSAVKKGMTFAQLEQALWEDRVFVKQAYGIPFDPDKDFKDKVLLDLPHFFRVERAMILEDVWQGLLQIPQVYNSWDPGPRTLPEYRALVQKHWDALVDTRKLTPEEHMQRFFEEDRNREDRFWTEDKDTTHSCSMGVKATFKLAVERFKKGLTTPEAVKDFLDTVAELNYIESILSDARYQWRPSYNNGPQQYGELEHQRSIYMLYAEIASKDLKVQAYENDEGYMSPTLRTVNVQVEVRFSSTVKNTKLQTVADLKKIPFLQVKSHDDDFVIVEIDRDVLDEVLYAVRNTTGVKGGRIRKKTS